MALRAAFLEKCEAEVGLVEIECVAHEAERIIDETQRLRSEEEAGIEAAAAYLVDTLAQGAAVLQIPERWDRSTVCAIIDNAGDLIAHRYEAARTRVETARGAVEQAALADLVNLAQCLGAALAAGEARLERRRMVCWRCAYWASKPIAVCIKVSPCRSPSARRCSKIRVRSIRRSRIGAPGGPDWSNPPKAALAGLEA